MQVNLNSNDRGKWSEVVARRPERRPAWAVLSQNHVTSGNNKCAGATSNDAGDSGPQMAGARRVTVPGVRRVREQRRMLVLPLYYKAYDNYQILILEKDWMWKGNFGKVCPVSVIDGGSWSGGLKLFLGSLKAFGATYPSKWAGS